MIQKLTDADGANIFIGASASPIYHPTLMGTVTHIEMDRFLDGPGVRIEMITPSPLAKWIRPKLLRIISK